MTNITNDDQTLSTFGINITGTNDSRTSEVAKNNVSIMEKKQDGGSDLFAVKTRQEMKMSLHFSPYATTFFCIWIQNQFNFARTYNFDKVFVLQELMFSVRCSSRNNGT